MSVPQAAQVQAERMDTLIRTIRRLMEKLQKELDTEHCRDAQADDLNLAA
jgi:hypothetical protein